MPGNITSKTSWGPNLLIKQGAKLVQEWNDVVTELPAEARRRLIEAGRSRLTGEQLALPGNEEAAESGGGDRTVDTGEIKSGLRYPSGRSIRYS